MNKTLKISLIVLGSIALAGGITYGVIKIVRKRRQEKENIERELEETQKLEEINEGLEGQESQESNMVIPVRNLDKGINNLFKDIKGVKLYPAIKSNDPKQGHPYADGYANVRFSAEVNNRSSWYDPFDNIMGTFSSGELIGTVISEKYDDMTPKMRWFKVKLPKKLKGKNYGWVRADVVTFKPFTKKKITKTKSSFDGSFVQKYNTSYQLGAEVFPHSNWMIGYPAYGKDVTSDFEGTLDLDM